MKNQRIAVPYMHAPFEALLFVPFTTLPITRAYLAWNGANLGVLVAFVFLLRRHLAGLKQCSRVFPIMFLLGFFPIFNALVEGQDAIVLLLLYGLVFVALRSTAWFEAGAWLGLGLFRLHLVLPFFLFMVLLKRWRVVAGFATSAIVLVLISGLIVGWQGIVNYPLYIWRLEQGIGRSILPGRDNPNLRGLIEGLLPSGFDPRITLLLVLLASVGGVVLVLNSCRAACQKPSILDLRFSLMLTMTVLVSYHTLFYDYTLLAIVIMVVGTYAFGTPLAPRRRAELLAPAAILSFLPLYLVFWVHRWEGSYLMAFVLMAWVWAQMREISRATTTGSVKGWAAGEHA